MTPRAVRVAAQAVETLESRRLFAAPALDAIPNQTVPVGKTVQIPVTSTSTGGAVTYSVRDSSGNVAGSFRPSSNTFIQMNVAGYSQPMVFELFNDTSPETVRRIVGLINSRFYDGLTFHRIINNFVIQGGDPKGDGTGGPDFTFDDEFNANTTFTGTGQLAMANSGKDTNGSQFFITEGPQRLLDFNHTIFGQLVRGEATRAAISDVNTDSSTGAPNTPVVITSVRVLKDVTDGVLVMSAKAAGTYNVKVTATNADGSTSDRFSITASPDTINDPPILNTAKLSKVYYTTVGKPVAIDLSSIDPEGDSGFYYAQFVSQNDATGAFSGTNNSTITVTPTKTGPITVSVGVNSSNTSTTRGSTSGSSASDLTVYDTQTVTIAVGDLPISASAANFDAPSGVATGSFLVGTVRSSDASAAASNYTAKIDWGDGTVSTGTLRKRASGRFAVYGNKTYGSKVNAQLPITLTVTGANGALATAEAVATVRPTTALSGGILTINGTSGDDRIGVSRKGRNYVVTVNRKTTTFPYAQVNSINAYGYDGSDLIQLAATVFAPSYLDGGAGNDALYGSVGDDVINGAAGNDTIHTGDGTNRVAGGDGNDTIVGGVGRDRLYGGAGNDNLDGGGGRDIVSGDSGNDVVVGGAGVDAVYGGAGRDTLNGGRGADVVDGGSGSDTARGDVLDTLTSIEVTV